MRKLSLLDEDDEVYGDDYIETTTDPGDTFLYIAIVICICSIACLPLFVKLGKGAYRDEHKKAMNITRKTLVLWFHPTVPPHTQRRLIRPIFPVSNDVGEEKCAIRLLCLFLIMSFDGESVAPTLVKILIEEGKQFRGAWQERRESPCCFINRWGNNV